MTRRPSSLLTSMPLLVLLSIIALALASPSSSSSSCSTSSSSTTATGECHHLLDASAFQRRVASVNTDESILPTLRGTASNLLSKEDIKTLVESLPMSDFVAASGYDDKGNNNRDGRAYNAPNAYAGLSLRELCTSNEDRYTKLLEIRERVRATTEQSLGLLPGTLLIDFTTVSQKTVGGAHRPHADNCLHYFDPKTNKAVCDPTRTHPYPKRIAASILYLNDNDSGNFSSGEFYFANPSNGGEVETIIPIESGKMIYFTSGLENMHGALAVQQKRGTVDSSSTSSNDIDDDGVEPRRLALAMWYVTEKELEEYVPAFQEATQQQQEEAAESSPAGSSQQQSKLKQRKVHDPTDPEAPTELFILAIPKSVDSDTLFQSMGSHLASKTKQNKQWQVIRGDGDDDVLHVLFQDHSAMFSLDFGVALDEPTEHAEASVVVERHTDGRKQASLLYRLQESVMLHSVLDAFVSVMASTLNDDEMQYLKTEVEKARGTLSARQA